MPDSQTHIKISPAETLDDETVLRIVHLVNDAYGAHHWLFPNERTNPADFREESSGTEVVLLFATDGEIIGTATIHGEDNGLYIGMVAVEPAQKGKGDGRRLLQTIEAIARERGFICLTLQSVVELGNAAYYIRQGFEIVDQEVKPAGTWGALAPYTLAKIQKMIVTQQHQ